MKLLWGAGATENAKALQREQPLQSFAGLGARPHEKCRGGVCPSCRRFQQHAKVHPNAAVDQEQCYFHHFHQLRGLTAAHQEGARGEQGWSRLQLWDSGLRPCLQSLAQHRPGGARLPTAEEPVSILHLSGLVQRAKGGCDADALGQERLLEQTACSAQRQIDRLQQLQQQPRRC
jgi:hypothetical protein